MSFGVSTTRMKSKGGTADALLGWWLLVAIGAAVTWLASSPAGIALLIIGALGAVVMWWRSEPGLEIVGDWGQGDGMRTFLRDLARTSAETGHPVARIVLPKRASDPCPVMLVHRSGSIRVAHLKLDDGGNMTATLEEHVNRRSLYEIADWADD
jgi:hypothetical protein